MNAAIRHYDFDIDPMQIPSVKAYIDAIDAYADFWLEDAIDHETISDFIKQTVINMTGMAHPNDIRYDLMRAIRRRERKLCQQ